MKKYMHKKRNMFQSNQSKPAASRPTPRRAPKLACRVVALLFLLVVAAGAELVVEVEGV
jgi:hypothetical protein